MKSSGVIVTLGMVSALAGACGLVSGEGDSETHWLARCESDADCDAPAACLCGLCTAACGADADCGDVPGGSRCVAGASAAICGAFASAGDLCLIECTDTPDCPLSHDCSFGACVRRPPAAPIENPSGDCVADGDGRRRGYETFGDELTYLPDCQSPVDRDYYRVFARSPTSALISPRPDGAFELGEPCRMVPIDPPHPLTDEVVRYGLCSPATTPAEIARVNDIAPEDALTIARYLNGLIRFRVNGSEDTGIGPYPIPADILEACELRRAVNSIAFREVCDLTERELRTGASSSRSYQGALAAEIAGRLNDLYDIGPECESALPLDLCVGGCGPFGGCAGTEMTCTRTCFDDRGCTWGDLRFCLSGVCQFFMPTGCL